jgi:3-methyladenine DNA glycosylase/8-oxoguanine DNA glycosylase
MLLTLPARAPFSLLAVMRSHGWLQLAPFAEDKPTGGLSYIAHLTSGKVISLLIQEAPGGVGVQVEETLTKIEQAEVASNVTWMLELEQGFSTFYALARGEPKLAHVEQKAMGRLLRSPTLFEEVVKTILTTNTLWAATIRMNLNLVTQFGAPLPSDPSRRAFPTPERLATTDVETLRAATRLGYRAPYILELAQRVAAGNLDLEALKTTDLPTLELRKQLLKIKGVGAYAAANLLMLLGRYDFIPIDSWAFKMVSHEWHGGQPVGNAEVEAAFEGWGAWKGLAYWMWDWSYKG